MSKLQIVVILLLVAALLVASVGAVFAGKGGSKATPRACRRGKVENKPHCTAAVSIDQERLNGQA